MCSDCRSSLERIIKEVNEAWELRGERWVVVQDVIIKTYQTIPEKGHEQRITENLKVVFTLKT